MVGKAQCAQTRLMQKIIALPIVSNARFCVVAIAVDFYDQPELWAIEIDDIRPDAVLTAELGAELPMPEVMPKPLFRFCHCFSESTA